MLISMAYAQEEITDVASQAAEMIDTPSPASAFAWNMGMVLILVVLFYLLLIRPQQKRFQAHKEMQDALKKGDKVSTAGGLLGKVDKIVNDNEAVIDLGNGIKVTALRSTLTTSDGADPTAPLKDDKKKDEKKK